MDYEKEYERLKGRYDRQAKKLKALQADVDGWQQILDANNAIVAAVVKKTGHTVQVTSNDIRDALSGETRLMVAYDAEKQEYSLSAAGGD